MTPKFVTPHYERNVSVTNNIKMLAKYSLRFNNRVAILKHFQQYPHDIARAAAPWLLQRRQLS
jgi:hypothetical protein